MAECARAELGTAAHDAHHAAATAGRAVLCGTGSVGGGRCCEDRAELARSNGDGAARGDPVRQLAIVEQAQAKILQLLLLGRREVPPCRADDQPTVALLGQVSVYTQASICIFSYVYWGRKNGCTISRVCEDSQRLLFECNMHFRFILG